MKAYYETGEIEKAGDYLNRVKTRYLKDADGELREYMMEVEKYTTQGDEASETEYQIKLATIEENTKDLDENFEQATQTAVVHF